MTAQVQRITPIVYQQSDLTPYVYDDNGAFIPLAAIATGLTAQTRFVAKTGSDVSGNGSLGAPYASIQAAITSITDESATKPYNIVVFPGTYTEAFLLEPFLYVVGTNEQDVTLSPPNTNWISSAFGPTGTKDCGISNVTFGTAFLADFNAVASLGAGSIQLNQIAYTLTLAIKGNNVNNSFVMADVIMPNNLAANPVLLITDISGVMSDVNLRNSAYSFVGTGLYSVNIFASNIGTSGAPSITWTGASTANFLSVRLHNTAPLLAFGSAPVMTVTGDGVIVRGAAITRTIAGPDANTTFDFSTFTAGATKLITGGLNILLANPTADRTYTFNNPASDTRVTIRNLSAFYISLAGTGYTTGSTGSDTYIPPLQTRELIFFPGTGWSTGNKPQFGTAVLVSGASANIPADIRTQSVITATLKTWNGDSTGAVVAAPSANRVVGTRAGGGVFKLSAINSVDGGVNSNDNGTYDWTISD